jgi:NTE family protein
VVININPLHRDEIPKDPQAIQNRINEISFNSSLFRELRAIAFVKRLLKDGALKPGSMKDILVHMISDDVLMNELTVATKMMPSPLVLARLQAAGQAAADGFLSRHKGDLNAQSTVSLDEMFS